MWKYLLLTCSLMSLCRGYRLLGFFPIIGKSQQLIFQPILHELAKRGHEVVFVTTIRPEFSHPNLEVRLIEPYIQMYEEYLGMLDIGKAWAFNIAYILHSMSLNYAEYLYGNDVTQSLIHGNESFDAVLMESLFFQEPESALMHRFNCPAIDISALPHHSWLNELAGLPDNPSYQIDFKAVTTDRMSFTERLHNTYVTLSAILVGYYHLWKMQAVMDKYFNYTGWESRPSINKLATNRSIILLNQDIVLDYPCPVAPHVKLVGGVNLRPNKPLPKDIRNFMDTAEDGIIYLSFGSNLKTSQLMKTNFGNVIFSVFENIPQKIIMKWEEDQPKPLPKNVMTYKWVPQQDVLSHKNCIIFVTHGGYLSLTEAVYHGVPVLVIPIFADQPKNMVQVESAGFGLQLASENITKESLSWALKELQQNPRYKREAVRRSQMIKQRKQTPLEEAIYWIEFAIKYPNFLTPRSVNLNYIQLYLIDVKLFVVSSFFILYKMIKLLSTYIIFKKKKVMIKKKDKEL